MRWTIDCSRRARREGAEWESEEIRSLEPGFSVQSWLDTYPLIAPRHKQRLVELLRRAGLQ